MSSVRVVGSINLDTVISVDNPLQSHSKERATSWIDTLGGSAAITSTWLAGRFRNQVSLVGSVGDDWAGHRALRWLVSAGVDTHGIHTRSQEPTRRAVAITSPDFKWIVTSPLRGDMPLSQSELQRGEYDHFHVATQLTPEQAQQVDRYWKEGTTSLELKSRTDDPFRHFADIVFLNSKELRDSFGLPVQQLSAETRALLTSRHDSLIVVTNGARSVVVLGGSQRDEFPVSQTPISGDRVGAGDAFNAGFLSSWLASRNSRQAVQQGLTAARECLGRRGGAWNWTDLC